MIEFTQIPTINLDISAESNFSASFETNNKYEIEKTHLIEEVN